MESRMEANIIHKCNNCGCCCEGRPDEVNFIITPLEAHRIAKYLKLSPKTFIETKCVNQGKLEVSIKTEGKNHTCVFLERKGNKGRVCGIYKARPSACYLFPVAIDDIISKDGNYLGFTFKLNPLTPDCKCCSNKAKPRTEQEFLQDSDPGYFNDDLDFMLKFLKFVAVLSTMDIDYTEIFNNLYLANSEEEMKTNFEIYYNKLVK